MANLGGRPLELRQLRAVVEDEVFGVPPDDDDRESRRRELRLHPAQAKCDRRAPVGDKRVEDRPTEAIDLLIDLEPLDANRLGRRSVCA